MTEKKRTLKQLRSHHGRRIAARFWPLILIILILLLPPPATAQTAPDYPARAAQLVERLRTPGGEEEFFSPVFLNAVPVAQWRALTESWRKDHGPPMALGAVTPDGPTSGSVEIRYARATLGFQLVLAPAAPHRVIGLRLTGVKQAGDTLAKVAADLAALPGNVAFAAARLGDGAPALILARDAERPMAVASSFKLYVLAELARATAAGERRWSDVAPLAHRSFSGRLSRYPDNAPMTLHSLAAAMIAESDNGASDTLMLALGRGKVDAMLALTGHAAPERALPLLTTTEAFALKMPAHRDLRDRWTSADASQRAALMAESTARLSASSIDVGQVAEKPIAIDSIEWFAAPLDMVRLLDWLRVNGGDALPIMAINPAIGPADAARWAWLGYKGGSEPGVIAMNFLGQRRDGQWIALAASWNNPAALVDEAAFHALMARALTLLSEGDFPEK